MYVFVRVLYFIEAKWMYMFKAMYMFIFVTKHPLSAFHI